MKNKGITLIALIITIIVLLILAGVVLNLTIGENGIVRKTQQSEKRYEEAKVKEEIGLMLSDYAIERYSKDRKLVDYFNEKKEAGIIEEVTDNSDGTVTITYKGYEITIKESDLTIIDITKQGIQVKVSNIKMTLEDGITEVQKYSQELGTKLLITFDANLEGGQITKIEPEIPYLTTGMELEKSFTIIGTINGEEITKIVKISLKDKYTLKIPEIRLSNNEWTNQSVIATVDWGNAGELDKKEISIDGGISYQEYVGPMEIPKNCVIKAKLSNELQEVIGELQVSNIDKLTPNKFTPTVSDLISSTELEIKANTQDQEATEEYGKSGMKEYEYFVYEGENLITKSERIKDESWIASGLTVGQTYDIYVEAYDNAGNVTKSETINYNKLEVYVWKQYKANKTTKYSYVEEPTILRCMAGTQVHYAKSGSVTKFFNKDTGKFNVGSLTESFFRIDASGYWVTTTADADSYTIYYITSIPSQVNTYYYQCEAIKYQSYSNTIYTKVDEILTYVKSNNINTYPDNDGQGDYWYEKVN